MKYISLFTGIGGFESAKHDPVLMCEKDKHCQDFLSRKYKNIELVDDVLTLSSKKFKLPKVDLVAGGWPCQDISVAGRQKGFNGKQSILFYQLLEIAVQSSSHTIVAENVPNLLNIEKGQVFVDVLNELKNAGFCHIAWRILNTREFNIPQQRRRLFIVASKDKQIAKNLFNMANIKISSPKNETKVSGFYQSAGTHSICYSENFVPTIKVTNGPSIHYKNIMRKLTAKESLKLQGFKVNDFKGIVDSHIYKMTGNAVTKKVGSFVFESLEKSMLNLNMNPLQLNSDFFSKDISEISYRPENGFFSKDVIYEVTLPEKELCSNLADFIDLNNNSFLSNTALLGMLRRAKKAKKPINVNLFNSILETVEPKNIVNEIGEDGIKDFKQGRFLENSSKELFEELLF
tara:strand:- start:715 stop:1923 length:1209 start_codon:yes stop_codon:yes gene_type:complete